MHLGQYPLSLFFGSRPTAYSVHHFRLDTKLTRVKEKRDGHSQLAVKTGFSNGAFFPSTIALYLASEVFVVFTGTVRVCATCRMSLLSLP